MKHYRKTLLIVALLMAVTAGAQQPRGQQPKFSPEKFRIEMEQFITQEACLTPQEAAAFFPIFNEMNHKLRLVYERQRQQGRIKPADEKGCRDAIKKRDELDVELKQIQQNYHNKMLNVIPASKLYDVINAEERFHRRELRRWTRFPMGPAGRTNRN